MGRAIPKLETMNSLNRVTVVSLILGPKRFKKVVLEDWDFASLSEADATVSAVRYEIPSSCNVFRISVCRLIRLICQNQLNVKNGLVTSNLIDRIAV
jgi:hypothetical protein